MPASPLLQLATKKVFEFIPCYVISVLAVISAREPGHKGVSQVHNIYMILHLILQLAMSPKKGLNRV